MAEDLAPGEIIADVSMGGEVADTIKKYLGKTVECLGVCFKPYVIDEFRAYPHDGGLADAQGKKWWLYVSCSHVLKSGRVCGYDLSWGKIERRLVNEGEEKV